MNDQADVLEADRALKQKHRAMWASGDYPALAGELLPELGAILVEACGINLRQRVLDVAAGAGNAAIPAAMMGAKVVASDLAPELFDAGRHQAADRGVELEWKEGDAEALPFGDGEFDTVMSCLGVMFAPHHQPAADELLRVCKPGGTIGLLSWTPEGFIGKMFAAMKPFAPPPPPGAQPAPLWGSEDHVRELLGDRVDLKTMQRDVLEITAFQQPRDYGEHFKSHYGPTITAQNNARKNEREDEFVEALNAFGDEWNRGAPDRARFEQEYLLIVGTRA
jgi:SAM-dependent methyltransferase